LAGRLSLVELTPFLLSELEEPAALHGQPWNASQVGRGLGISYQTVNSYLDYPVVASWEGYVIEQTLGELAALWRVFGTYYSRTSDQHEVDLVLELLRSGG